MHHKLNQVLMRIAFAFLFVVIASGSNYGADQKDTKKPKVYTNREDNAKCFKCHGTNKFKVVNADGKVYRHKMPSDYIIDTAAYYNSNHWNFKCFDCHTDEYAEVPHKRELKFQSIANCLDRHGGDANFAKYNFEKIQIDFEASIHSSRHNKDFSCWSCHDAHTYKINASNKSQPITKTVAYDNSICLSCHANKDKYQLVKDTINPNVITKHDWLPNQISHFKNVRCIECHAKYNDSTMVAHNIQPKSKAVKNCTACHSTNSMLKKSLYRYLVQERRNKVGFFNASMLAESYVIGANRNYYLNLISAVIFGLIICGIAIHIILRTRK